MADSGKSIRVYRDSWMPEHVALLCGIANAGGGVLSVASTSKNYSKGFKRMRKSFEQIPVLAQQELGIVCTTQPVLEGPALCLEIDVPAADPLKPLRYKGGCRFYDDETGENLSLNPDEIAERRLGAPSAPQTAADQGFDAVDAAIASAATASITSTSAQSRAAQEADVASADAASTQPEDLLQLFTALADRFAQAGGNVQVSQEDGSITFSLPQGTSTQSSAALEQVGASSVRRANPDAETFAERSIAAANGFDLTSTDEYILRVLNTNGRATAPRIAEVLGVSESTVRRSFKRLKELQLIKRVGSAKAGYWRVNS